MPLHRDSTLENIHRHHRWEVNNQAGLDALVPDALDIHKVAYKKDDDTYHVLKSVSPTVWVQTAYTKAKVDELLGSKQDTLVSGTNIKTINGQSVLGNGNIFVTALQVGAYSKSENDNLLIKKANLDINNKIPLSEIPDSILGQLKYMGVWDFSSGFPTGAEKGNYWITSVSGNGYEVGDWAVYNGTSFDKVDNTDAVSSVAGRTGNVVLNKNDVGLNNVDNTSDLNKPISNATQTALNLKADDNTVVKLTGNQTIADVKTFSSSIVGNITGNASLNLPLTGGTMTGAITAIREKKVAMAANNIDLATGNLFTKTIVGATTLTISGALPNENANSFILELTNGGSGIITWWSGMKWAGGTAPTLTTAGVDILGFYSHDGGTTWRGMLMSKDSK